jgi:hypothetical protein
MSGQAHESLAPPDCLAKSDRDQIQQMIRFIERHTTSSALQHILPLSCATARELLARHTRFDHGAALIFPEYPAQASAALAQHGLTAADPVPSVVVRDRLAKRYHLPIEELPLMITRAQSIKSGDRALELFMLSSRAPRLRTLIRGERSHHNETHLAFCVIGPQERSLGRIWNVLTGETGFTADGGGFNPHQGASGCTVLYFHDSTRLTPYRWPQRIEIIADGHHLRILQRHIHASEAIPQRRSDRSRRAFGCDGGWW